jgi:4-amino-4-deoxy-L-arabinose transferase-like glycosyltransferase
MHKPSLRIRDLTFPLLAAAILLLPALGLTPFRRAEIYFVDASRAMVERHDWIVPYFRGQPFFDKPALTYWLQAASFEVFGFTAAAARLSPAVVALLVIAATIWLSWLLWRDKTSALASGWILLSTLSFMAFGRTAMSDMLLTLFTVLAVALGICCCKSRRVPLLPLIGLGAVLGLGFLTKGPIALLIPGLGLLCLLWERRRDLPTLPIDGVVLSFLAFVTFAFGWFVVVYGRLGVEPLKYFFVHENLQRFAGSAYNAGRPLWFYLVTYLGQGAPWSLFFPLAALELLRRRKDSSARMLVLWMLLVGALLTSSRGKVDYYILPLYPASSVLIGRYLAISSWSRVERLFASVVAAVIGLTLSLLPVALLRVPEAWRPQGSALTVASIAFAGAGISCLFAAIRSNPKMIGITLTAALSLSFFVVNLQLLPAFYKAEPNDRVVAIAAKALATRPDAKVAAHEDLIQVHRDLLFYNRTVVENSPDLAAVASAARPYLILTNPDEAVALKALPHVREVGTFPYLSSKVFTLRGLFSRSDPDRLVLLANFDF